MLLTDNSQIKKFIVHKIGNKNTNEKNIFSENYIILDDNLQKQMLTFFTNSFKTPEFYSFFNEVDLSKNIVYNFIQQIFNFENQFVNISKEIANHLYEISTHPRIKNGDFYLVQFENITYDGVTTDAIGIFKTENYESFIKIGKSENSFELISDYGVNIDKYVDKGCLILNTQKEDGYIVFIVDQSGKGNDAKYWTEEFLRIRLKANEFLFTSQVINICKNYVKDILPEEFEITKADQADILNKGLKFMKNEEQFNFEKFSKEVFGQPEVINSFNNFKQNYIAENEISIENEFEICENALKKNQRYLKSVIKLDKNFHIYVHGKKELIERGYDKDTNMHYYKLFFKDEL